MIALTKSLGVKGCAIYALSDAGKPLSNTPIADNVSITLPAIELETNSINLMGTFDVPDVSRLGNMQLTVNVPLDVAASQELFTIGRLARWQITWCSQEYDSITGITAIKSYLVTATGFVTSIPNAEVNQGAENTGDVTMNLVTYSKICTTDRKLIFAIDRGKGKFIINGEDIYAKFNLAY